jgi:hypothetical protein
MAVTGGTATVVSLLLNAGAAPDALDVRGMTPLRWAVATDRPLVKIIRLLLERGADVSIRSKADETVADWARTLCVTRVLITSGRPGWAAPTVASATTGCHRDATIHASRLFVRTIGN